MNAKSIMEKKFDKGFNGYKMEEVDDFLSEISEAYAQLEAQNESLEKKLEVLADKIREYRNDEEAIKEALLGAQKQSASVIASADEKSKEMLAEAEEKAAAMVKEAEETVAKRQEEAERIISEAKLEKERIIFECNAKSAEITGAMEREIKKYEAVLARTRKESEEFTQRLLSQYKTHIELIKLIPEKCDNDFVKQVSENFVEPQPAPEQTEETEEQPAMVEEAVEEVYEEAVSVEANDEKVTDLSDIEAVFAKPADNAEAKDLTKTSELPFQPVFEEEENSAEEVELDDDSSPFFNKKAKRRSKYEKLEFGGKSE